MIMHVIGHDRAAEGFLTVGEILSEKQPEVFGTFQRLIDFGPPHPVRITGGYEYFERLMQEPPRPGRAGCEGVG